MMDSGRSEVLARIIVLARVRFIVPHIISDKHHTTGMMVIGLGLWQVIAGF